MTNKISNIELFIIIVCLIIVLTQIKKDNTNNQNKIAEQFCSNCGKYRRYPHARSYYDYFNYYDYYYPSFGYTYFPLPCIKTLFGELKCY